MRRILALLLLLSMVLSLAGCGTEFAPAATEGTAAEAVTEEVTEAPTETEPPKPATEGNLYLKVSGITFSLVGESEDVYLGIVPRELVTWESENPEIISVENGVLTAVGVGTTVIHASYEDRKVSCTAGCLAETREELVLLDDEILSTPKWTIPEVDLEEPCTYFDKAGIVGDSITYGMMQHEARSNALGKILFLARGGVSIMGFIKGVKHIVYQGQEMPLEDIVEKAGLERVYFLMGSNDVAAGYEMDAMMENWSIVLDKIWEKSPNVEIVLISSLPRFEVWPERPREDLYNPRTLEYNAALQELAKEKGCQYLNLHPFVEDHWGRLSPVCKIDDTHLNEEYCNVWMKLMRYYAQFESEGGILE